MTEGKKPKLPIKELATAGANAPLVLVRYTVERRGPTFAADAAARRAAPDFDVERHVDTLVASQLMLVRGQGALAGLAITAAEAAGTAETAATVGTGTGLAIAGSAAVILTDVATLSYFQIELSLKIAAAYGHDLSDSETRAREILHLHGLTMIGGDSLVKPLGKGGERVGRRLLMRYLRGRNLQAAKALFRFAGIKFTRSGLLKLLPLVNVPIGVAIADVTTRRAAKKSRKFYRNLPMAPTSISAPTG